MKSVAILLAIALLPGNAVASGPAVSSTTVADSAPSMPVQFSSSSIKVGVTPAMELSLPDGDSRIMVENNVEGRSLKLGTRYNFVFGKIRYWASYGMPVYRDLVNLETAISDDIGYGRIYYDTKFLERARTGLAGLRFNVGAAALFMSVGRTDWHLAPFAEPDLEDAGLIDAVILDVVPAVDFSVLSEALEPEVTRFRYKRAFRGMGGDWHFDKLEGDVTWDIPSFRVADEAAFRAVVGQSLNIAPDFPLRETFALGGASALKGYHYEEYRGTGVLLGGLEYGINLPFQLETVRWKAGLIRNYFMVFGEVGRTEHGWLRPDIPFKKSAGAGLKLQGHWGTRRLNLRMFGAEALDANRRAPVWYLMLDLK